MAENEYNDDDNHLDDDDEDLNGPLDIRYVIGGSLLMITSLPLMVFYGNQITKIICAVCFMASFALLGIKKKVEADVAGKSDEGDTSLRTNERDENK